MKQPEVIRVENGTDLILALLYAGGLRKPKNEEVIGNTRLDKLLFLLEQESPLKKYLADFKYEAYNYGPYSSEVFDAIQALINAGLVRMQSSPSEGFLEEADRYQIETEALDNISSPKETVVYSLTQEGETVASALFNTLSKEEQNELVAMKTKFNSISLRKLLQYVYRKYPEFTTESVIREDIFQS